MTYVGDTLPIVLMKNMDTKEAADKTEYEKAKALLSSYLNERMRVTISDGRVIDGRLICTDRDCNLVLSNCEEFLSQEEMSKKEKNSILLDGQ